MRRSTIDSERESLRVPWRGIKIHQESNPVRSCRKSAFQVI